MIYYTADLHLNSYRNLSYRPFETMEEMNSTILHNFNQKVGKGDILVIVGDVGSCSNPPFELVRKMHGRKILVLGNNDMPVMGRKRFRELFEKIVIGNYMFYDKYIKETIFLNHFPCASWTCSREGKLHFFGHIHSLKTDGYEQMMQIPNAYNVGVDVRDFMPVTAQEILEAGK